MSALPLSPAPSPSATDEVESIGDLFDLSTPARVWAFMEEHPSLAPLLVEAVPPLREQFPRSYLRLEVITDPEEPLRRQLLVAIGTDLPPKLALSALARFDRDWWNANVTRAGGTVCIDVEFV